MRTMAMMALATLSGCGVCGNGASSTCNDPAVLPNEGAWRLLDSGCDRRDADCLYEGSVVIDGDLVIVEYLDHDDVKQRATYRMQ